MTSTRLGICACLLLVISSSAALADDSKPVRSNTAERDVIPDALQKYVARDEPDYAWSLEETRKVGSTTIYRLRLTSQKWQNIVWRHNLTVFEPPKLEHPRHMILYIGGGKNGDRLSDGDMLLGLQLSAMAGCRVATLNQVPNQPLMGNKVEDDLITETWLKYLETGDETWPLLFPMVKSAVKAMDAVQSFGESKGFEKIEGFVISGASKRGWTSWLTPVADRRIIATAPIVIDMLNFRAQMKYQMETWGKYSEQINDYTRKGLAKIAEGSENPRETMLRTMMDPYTYRSRLTLPKLLIVGTNDRYWTVDAMTRYYDGLVGPKHVLACPNVGHNLGDKKILALTTLAAFFRHAAAGRAMPHVDWTWTNGGPDLHLAVKCDPAPLAAYAWTTTSETKDFRESKWSSHEINVTEGRCVLKTPKPIGSHLAQYIELQYEIGELRYSLTTQAFRE